MKQVYCVFKEGEGWEDSEELVAIFTTKELANQYKQKHKDPSIYRISVRKVLDKIN